MLVDSHCHLTDERLKDRVEIVVKEAGKEGVRRIMVASGNVKDGEIVIGLVRRFKDVSVTF